MQRCSEQLVIMHGFSFAIVRLYIDEGRFSHAVVYKIFGRTVL